MAAVSAQANNCRILGTSGPPGRHHIFTMRIGQLIPEHINPDDLHLTPVPLFSRRYSECMFPRQLLFSRQRPTAAESRIGTDPPDPTPLMEPRHVGTAGYHRNNPQY